MPIRWNPATVHEALQRVEAFLDQAQPFLEQANKEAEAATRIRNLPEYMVEPLRGFSGDIQQMLSRCRKRLAILRERIPKAPVARSQAPAGPTLF
jgi:hypothetical protein